MESTAMFEKETASKVEQTVCEVFECIRPDIIGFGDTVPKKVVVFILSKFYGFDKRLIGNEYKITYLFVPTVVEKIELQMLRNEVFRAKILAVCRAVNYSNNLKNSLLN